MIFRGLFLCSGEEKCRFDHRNIFNLFLNLEKIREESSGIK